MLNHCPSRDRLRHYLSESLGDAEQVEIDQHLEDCGSCDAVMLEISGSPELDRWLSLAHTRTYGAEPVVDRSFVRKLRDLGSEEADQVGELAFPMPSDKQGPLGRVGHYHFIERVGSGGMGIVYKALDDRLNRFVAIKVLAPELATVDSHRQQFRREASRAAQVKHDDIVSIHDVNDGEGFLPFLVMEWIEGGTLADRIKQSGAIGPREAAKICQEVADGLAVAHEAGLVHRDIKSSNIMLDANSGRARITDFGLARAVDDPVTQTSTVAGTPAYMSFEQVRSPAEIDGRSDLYSLGVVLYESVTGERPFRGVTNHDILMQVVHEEPRPPRQLNRAIPRDLETICLKCLEKDASKRYATADELGEDLGRFLDGREIKARPAGTVEKAVRWARRKPWQAAAVGLLLFAVALIAGLAAVSTSAAAKQANLRKVAEAGRTRAEKMQRLSEARQTQFQYKLATLSLQIGDSQAALDALRDVPKGTSSWETRYLQYQTSVQPTIASTLAEGHWGMLDAAMNPDESQVVTCDSSGLVLVWDLKEGKVSHRLAEGRWSDRVRRWLHHFEGRAAESEVKQWGTCMTSLAWMGNGTRVAAASLDGTAFILDVTGKPASEVFKADDPLYAVASSSDGSRLLFGSATGQVFLRSGGGDPLARQKLSDSAVTVLAFLESGHRWIVGQEDGRIGILDGETLEKLATIELPGPIWDLDAVQVHEQSLLVVACQSPDAKLIEVVNDEPRLRIAESIKLASENSTTPALHEVSFSPDGKYIYAVDDTRHLIRWNRQSRLLDWTVNGIRRDERLLSLRRDGTNDSGLEKLPLPFHRTACAVLGFDRGTRLLTAGEDAVVKVWEKIQPEEARPTVIDASAGKSPHIVFDLQSPELLWSLDRDGVLRVIDVAADKIVAEKKAHAGGASDLAVIADPFRTVTVGADGVLRFWRLADNKIIKADPAKIAHDRPLLSVTVSHDRRWIAAVDDRARLAVWDLATSERVFLTRLSVSRAADAPPDEPLTGRLAFNCDGTMLAAFGSDQSAVVFGTNPFRRLEEQIWVSGDGGTALCWSPKSPAVLLVADTYPRFLVRVFGNEEVIQKGTRDQPPTPIVGFEISSDQRRLVRLEEGGRMTFMDAEHLIDLLELRSSFKDAQDMAFDKLDRRIALVNQTGRIEIWDNQEKNDKDAVEAEDDSQEWSDELLIEPTAVAIRVDQRGVELDAQDRLGMLYVESHQGDFRNEGALHFVRDDTGYAHRERIEVDGKAADRRTAFDAVAIGFQPNDEPLAVFRRRTELPGAYDGMVHLGRRVERNKWEFETIHDRGNWGFYPLLRFSADGNLASVTHFSFSGQYLVQSSLAGGSWGYQKIGQQGDGLDVRGKWAPDGQLHMVFKPNRFNGDPHPRVYARCDGNEFFREVIDAAQPVNRHGVEFTPDGSPVVVVGTNMMRRSPNGWVKYATLPAPLSSDFAIDRDGKIYFASWDQATQRLLLWQHENGEWKASVLAKSFPEGTPNFWAIRLDRSDRPVIVVGRIHEPYGWIRVLRHKG